MIAPGEERNRGLAWCEYLARADAELVIGPSCGGAPSRGYRRLGDRTRRSVAQRTESRIHTVLTFRHDRILAPMCSMAFLAVAARTNPLTAGFGEDATHLEQFRSISQRRFYVGASQITFYTLQQAASKAADEGAEGCGANASATGSLTWAWAGAASLALNAENATTRKTHARLVGLPCGTYFSSRAFFSTTANIFCSRLRSSNPICSKNSGNTRTTAAAKLRPPRPAPIGVSKA